MFDKLFKDYFNSFDDPEDDYCPECGEIVSQEDGLCWNCEYGMDDYDIDEDDIDERLFDEY